MRNRIKAIGKLWMASILVLISGVVRSSIAAEAGGPGAFSATSSRSAPLTPMSAPPTGPTLLIVKQGVNYNLAGWEELYNGCVISSGSWQVTQPPTHGSTSTQIITSGTDACGNPNQYNTIFYTWTDTSAKSGTGQYECRWSTSDGRFFDPYNWTFDYQALQNSQDYGGSGRAVPGGISIMEYRLCMLLDNSCPALPRVWLPASRLHSQRWEIYLKVSVVGQRRTSTVTAKPTSFGKTPAATSRSGF